MEKIHNKDLEKVSGGQRDYELPKDKVIIITTCKNKTETEADSNPNHVHRPD